jgi:hypothetical protein
VIICSISNALRDGLEEDGKAIIIQKQVHRGEEGVRKEQHAHFVEGIYKLELGNNHELRYIKFDYFFLFKDNI